MKKFFKNNPRYLLWAGAGLAVVLILVFIFQPSKEQSGTIPSTSPSEKIAALSSDKSTTTSPNPASGSDKSSPNPPAAPSASTSNIELKSPFGTFVSNHHPNLGGSPAPSQEQSVCNSTPGATCYIQFTKNGITKKLDPLKVDSTGSVIWNWDVDKSGFSSGSWQITAIATLNGQTKSTVDDLVLSVEP